MYKFVKTHRPAHGNGAADVGGVACGGVVVVDFNSHSRSNVRLIPHYTFHVWSSYSEAGWEDGVS